MNHTANTVRLLIVDVQAHRKAIAHHYAKRSNKSNRAAVRAWIKELRRIDKNSGYSKAAEQSGLSVPTYRTN